ncbi:hypothetical protein B1748_08995 [Paenibacillus sp. MY03]|uniref:extracellular solute-binding protein n=1 Tax=Paenibacillus sp. MY03 TaxID=302980 RepID=UPI000B3C5FEF|nr:extracellular solute-binding protein [Paenibacillus sp. MY03]OUS77268.1 hypothetical protein B1748_08995 [Paenibacillus sp. MY03]
MYFKVRTAALLSALLVLLPACADKSEETSAATEFPAAVDVSKAGMPIVQEPITLQMMVSIRDTTGLDLNEVAAFRKLQEITNVQIKWDQVLISAIKEKRNLALASDTLPDAFFAAALPNEDLLKYGEQGTFIPLNALIDDYAPNLKKVLDTNPDIRRAITFPNGNIYSLPYLNEPSSTALRTFPIFYYNQDWLEALEMKAPETTEQFYDYLKAVKNGDPNKNGLFDEIPYGGNSVALLVNALSSAFDVRNRGQDFIDIAPQSESLRFYPVSERYREMLTYIHRLYGEKLINQNLFSINGNQYYTDAANGLYGSTVYYDPTTVFTGVAKEAFTAGLPLKGPHGDQNKVISHVIRAQSGFVITSKNKHPEATMRWADYFYSEEGMKLLSMGVENESFQKTLDGEYALTDAIRNPPAGVTQDQALAKYAIYVNIGTPIGILDQKFWKGAETTPDALQAIDRMKDMLADGAWPPFTYTEEEGKRLAGLSADIEKYVIEMQAKFITGVVPFSDWNNYVKTIESMGLEEYMQIKGAAYSRYSDG